VQLRYFRERIGSHQGSITARTKEKSAKWPKEGSERAAEAVLIIGEEYLYQGAYPQVGKAKVSCWHGCPKPGGNDLLKKRGAPRERRGEEFRKRYNPPVERGLCRRSAFKANGGRGKKRS